MTVVPTLVVWCSMCDAIEVPWHRPGLGLALKACRRLYRTQCASNHMQSQPVSNDATTVRSLMRCTHATNPECRMAIPLTARDPLALVLGQPMHPPPWPTLQHRISRLPNFGYLIEPSLATATHAATSTHCNKTTVRNNIARRSIHRKQSHGRLAPACWAANGRCSHFAPPPTHTHIAPQAPAHPTTYSNSRETAAPPGLSLCTCPALHACHHAWPHLTAGQPGFPCTGLARPRETWRTQIRH